ncbi:hypothetical protein GCM10010344_03220 [Streptomyces bluensis]|nr:hypothetical protein GCM10010344_03220 [Streptomyces bluensis]
MREASAAASLRALAGAPGTATARAVAAATSEAVVTDRLRVDLKTDLRVGLWGVELTRTPCATAVVGRTAEREPGTRMGARVVQGELRCGCGNAMRVRGHRW